MTEEDTISTTDEHRVVVNYYSLEETHQSFIHGLCLGIFVMGVVAAIIFWVVT